jgi:hypothetical protein
MTRAIILYVCGRAGFKAYKEVERSKAWATILCVARWGLR